MRYQLTVRRGSQTARAARADSRRKFHGLRAAIVGFLALSAGVGVLLAAMALGVVIAVLILIVVAAAVVWSIVTGLLRDPGRDLKRPP
jgi:hypothetical protein